MILYRRARGVELIHCFTQVLLSLVIYTGCVHTMASLVRVKLIGEFDNYVVYGFLIAAGLLFDYVRNNPGKQNLLNLDLPANVFRSTRQLFTTLVIIMFAIVALKDNSISRLFFFGFIPTFFVLLFVTNKFLPSIIARFVFDKRHKKRTILVGSSKSVSALEDGFKESTFTASRSWACLPMRSIQPCQTVTKCLAGRMNWRRKSPPPGDPGLPARNTRQFGEIKQMSEMCDNLGARLLVVCNWTDLIGRKMDIFGDDGVDLISFLDEPLECPFNRTTKRLLDVAVSLPVVALVLPFTNFIVWLFQRIQSPGPLFFRQIRSGIMARNLKSSSIAR